MIKKCVNQHYYDGDKFPNCPFCGGADITNGSTAAQNPSVLPQLDNNDEETLPLAFYQKSHPQKGHVEQLNLEFTLLFSSSGMGKRNRVQMGEETEEHRRQRRHN